MHLKASLIYRVRIRNLALIKFGPHDWFLHAFLVHIPTYSYAKLAVLSSAVLQSPLRRTPRRRNLQRLPPPPRWKKAY